jgi:hypothetical protein
VLSPYGSDVTPSQQAASPVTGSVDGDTVTVTSYDNLEGVYNAGFAWSTTDGEWEPASFVDNASFFSGDFNTVTSQTTPTPPYGDNLLGIIEPFGDNPGSAQVTLSFAQTLSFVEFQVTSAVNSNFTATLVAYGESGAILGTYLVTDVGTGGACGSLNQGPPVPCTPTSPFVQFYDSQDLIASVQLTVNDTAGAYIDTLQTASSVAPEPSSFAALGIGILALLLWSVKRGRFQLAIRLTGAAPR